MIDTDRALLAQIQSETVAVLREVVGEGQPVALLDFPNHDNVGDNAIWVGQRAYLRRLGCDVRYTCDLRKFDPDLLRRRVPSGPILLQGGGNWGDIYDAYQRFRESVLATFPDRRIVQLPQSVWFRSAENAARANEVFGAHPDFTLLVREHDSMERCRTLLPDVRTVLCHDSAFGVGPLRRRRPEVPLVALMRRDVESAQAAAPQVDGDVVDWGLSGASKVVDLSLRLPGYLSRRAPSPVRSALRPVVAASMEAQARHHVRAGALLLARGERVVTDRLHAHVLCVLLGIHHVTLDNTYGKIAAVQGASSAGFSTVTAAGRTLEDADLTSLLA